MEKQKWTFTEHTYALGDTGDYDAYVQFTNGKDILQTSGDELEEEHLQQFCDLLDCMPDLWSHRLDNAEFELSQLKKKVLKFERALKKINNIRFKDGETYQEQVILLQYIAFDALYDKKDYKHYSKE